VSARKKNRYDGTYAKVMGDPAYWAVDKGERRKVVDTEMLYNIGLRPVVTILQEELDEIPLVEGEKN
jgi:hypothetical protein